MDRLSPRPWTTPDRHKLVITNEENNDEIFYHYTSKRFVDTLEDLRELTVGKV